MAVDMFLKLGDIKGESQDKTHKEEIDVLAWSWGISQSGTTHLGGGSGAGKASFQDISVTSYYEKSTPHVMTKCATGDHIPEATLTVRKAGGKQVEYIIYTLKDIIVTSVSTGGSGGEDRLTANFSLNFGAFETIYKPQDEKGNLGADIAFNYDIAANEKKS